MNSPPVRMIGRWWCSLRPIMVMKLITCFPKYLHVILAISTVDDFVTSAQLVEPFCDGVDLNCGCPQRWALQEGIGACLIDKPQFVFDLVKQVRN